MARNKKLLMKEINTELGQCQHILESVGDTPTFQEVMAAAGAAQRAAAQLHRLAGMLDVESDLPPPPSSRSYTTI